jgi:hypothetical protein
MVIFLTDSSGDQRDFSRYGGSVTVGFHQQVNMIGGDSIVEVLQTKAFVRLSKPGHEVRSVVGKLNRDTFSWQRWVMWRIWPRM